VTPGTPLRALRDDELVVVPAERHVERLARQGKRGETRTSLRARLAAALLPDVRFADLRETRLTLAVALEDAVSSNGTRAQLDLFGGAGAGPEDPLLATLRGRGGASWVRAVAAIDEAIGALRSRGATAAHLVRVRGAGVAAARARTLAAAMRALDEALARAGARDGRLVGAALGPAIRAADPDALLALLDARRVRARWLLAWEPQDLLWWRALDEALSRGSGYARVVLPAFDKRLEGTRERDPLEVIADVVARHLDAAPETEVIPAVLGDLGATMPRVEDAAPRVRLLRAGDARSEARAVARLVRSALDAGASVERIAIAYPSRDERTLLPLRRALADESIVFHDALGSPPSSVPVVAAALHALDAAESFDRIAVARVLRSGYIDAPRVLGDAGGEPLGFREAERILGRIARALETRATAAGADEVERLVLTATGGKDEDEAPARRIAAILTRARSARTRGERVRAARALFHDLGFASRAGRGALATFARDEAPFGIDRAERLAIARDVRAWDVVDAALDIYETTVVRDAGVCARTLDAEVFRLELTELLDASAHLPGAGRAGAVRITRLADVAGDELDLLVVLDANDGVLPRDVQPVTLVSEALEGAVARAARDAFVPIHVSEVAARDLAALAAGAAESSKVVLVTTAVDGAETPASPSRVFIALDRAGIAVEDVPRAGAGPAPAGTLQDPGEVARRAGRERAREGFFLDPMRPQSEIAGNLALGSTSSDAIARVVSAETGSLRERALAVTSIERFAQCAFKGYAHVVLAAREGEEQRELPDAREEGNLGHTALAAAFVATRDEWPRRPRDSAAILAKGLAAADVALAESAGHAPLRAIVRLRIRESVRAVLVRAIEDVDWDFSLAEQAFGNGKPWPSFQVTDGVTDVWLRGSIDRVDHAHGRSTAVRVIDYKRSKNTVRDASSLLGETALQVPIYALVAGRRLEASATGAYVPMQPRDLATETKPNTKAEDRVAELARREASSVPSEIERRVLQIAVEARAGRFAPVPVREGECTHCGVSGGCRKPRFAMAPSDELEDKESS